MSKKISLFWIPICVVLAAVLSFDIAYFAVSSKYADAVDKAVAKEKEKYSYGNLRSIEQLVEENFDGKVDEKKLSDSLIRGYIGGLDDKYSVYMTSDEYREYIEIENGNSVGIGIYIKYNEDNEGIEVIRVIPDSPAEKCGLHVGDMITGVDGKTVFDGWRAGDAAASAVVDMYIEYLGCGLTNIVNTFQPEMLLIGGGICKEGENLTKPLYEFINRESYCVDAEKVTKLGICQLGNDAGIIGAAFLYSL